MMKSLFIAIGIALPLVSGDGVKKPVQTTATERFDFAAGGLIRLSDSYGDLSIEGWDKPEVEIVVTKSLPRYYTAQEMEKTKDRLANVNVVAQKNSGSEMTISTSAKKRRGVTIEYQIRVPRDSRLSIHHSGGNILVSNVTGDIEATSRNGDIMLMLPETGRYAIDARSKIGTVASDFDGEGHVRHLVGERFAAASSGQARRIFLRMAFGGITIKAVPAGAY